MASVLLGAPTNSYFKEIHAKRTLDEQVTLDTNAKAN